MAPPYWTPGLTGRLIGLDTGGGSYAPRSVQPVGSSDLAVGTSDLVVASFNVHSGVDGWGRRFDLIDVCAKLDADVIVLQESWTPDGGRPMAEEISEKLGYEAYEFATARGRLSGPHPHPGAKWKPPSRRFDGPRVVLPDQTRAAAKTATSTTSPIWPANRRWPHGTGSETGPAEVRQRPARRTSGGRRDQARGRSRLRYPHVAPVERITASVLATPQGTRTGGSPRRARRRHEPLGSPFGCTAAWLAPGCDRTHLARMVAAQPA
jgi:hypothetical protein